MALDIMFIKKNSLSDSFIEATLQGYNTLPLSARRALDQHKFNLIAGEKVCELHPDLKTRPKCPAIFYPEIKSIFIGASTYRSPEKGWIAVSAERVRHYVFHETGHFADMFISGSGFGQKNYASRESYASLRPDFIAAHRQDAQILEQTSFAALYEQHENKDETVQRKIRRRLDYYYTSPLETYAEIWAQIHDGPAATENLRPLFPACTKIVENHLP